jgi:hypothetical protein
MTMRTAIRATQSPMNALRWCLDLSCGHDKWVNSDGKPSTPRQIECSKCDEEQRAREIAR